MPRKLFFTPDTVVSMIREVSKLHGIRYHELAAVSCIPAGTVGCIMGGANTTNERLSSLWKATLVLADERLRAMRLVNVASHQRAEDSRKNLEKIKSLIASS